MEYQIYSLTTKSTLHDNNEDNYSIGDGYVVVADGMGGECDGDIASRIAVDAITDALSGKIPGSASESYIKTLAFAAIGNADAGISGYIDNNPDSFGMGTTVLLSIIKDNRLYISWCGDSHCYCYSKGHVRSITRDHSYVQELVDAGEITEDESFSHPDNYLVTRYVGGGGETCRPDFKVFEVSDNDLIIMCSDGLSGYCRLDDIAETVSSVEDLSELPGKLTNLAVSHGSDDDITIVVLVPESYMPGKPSDTFFGWLKKAILKQRRG